MKKLFKNCPYEERKTCEGCPLLKKCMLKKIRRRIRRKVRRIDIRKLLVVLVIFCVIIFIIFKNFNNNDDSNNKKITTITTVETVVNQSYIHTSVQKQESILAERKTVAIKSNKTTKVTKKKIKATISSDGPSEEYYYNISDYDKKVIEKLVYQESRGECLKGKVAVAAVVLNRYTSKSKKFDTSSIEAVVTQKYQFANISSVTEEQLATVPECKDAVEMALKGWDPTRQKFPEGAKYFYEPNMVYGYQKKIRQGIEVLEIGNHNFHNDFNIP